MIIVKTENNERPSKNVSKSFTKGVKALKKIDKKELHELFVGLKNKNQNAYNKLYEKYYNLVYGITFSILKNKEDSEDIAHEIFTKIYKLPVDKLPDNSEASWLYTVSKNECFLHLRKSRPNISIDEIYEIPSELSEIDKVVDSEYYNKLMSGLKEDEKMIVSLKVLSDFTFKKISQVMNIPIGTVQWKYYNAINSIKISIGSLVGATMAFIFVIARGEFWKKQNYFDRDNYRNNDVKEDSVNQNESINESATSSDNKLNERDASSVSGSDADNKAQQNINDVSKNVSSETKEAIEVLDKSERFIDRIDVIQASFLILGLTFLTIFIIFFKKYQQKLRKKSSK